MARACVMRNGSIYNPQEDPVLPVTKEDPVLPGFEGVENAQEPLPEELLPASEEATESADENSEAEGHTDEADTVSEESEEVVTFEGSKDAEEK